MAPRSAPAPERLLCRSPPQREGPGAGDSAGERAGERAGDREGAREAGGSATAREAMIPLRSAARAVAMGAGRCRLPPQGLRPNGRAGPAPPAGTPGLWAPPRCRVLGPPCAPRPAGPSPVPPAPFRCYISTPLPRHPCFTPFSPPPVMPFRALLSNIPRRENNFHTPVQYRAQAFPTPGELESRGCLTPNC